MPVVSPDIPMALSDQELALGMMLVLHVQIPQREVVSVAMVMCCPHGQSLLALDQKRLRMSARLPANVLARPVDEQARRLVGDDHLVQPVAEYRTADHRLLHHSLNCQMQNGTAIQRSIQA